VTNGLTATVVLSLLFDPAEASTLYAGTNAGVFVSTDNGASWTPMNVGLTGCMKTGGCLQHRRREIVVGVESVGDGVSHEAMGFATRPCPRAAILQTVSTRRS
jgi:hypothetical protein